MARKAATVATAGPERYEVIPPSAGLSEIVAALRAFIGHCDDAREVDQLDWLVMYLRTFERTAQEARNRGRSFEYRTDRSQR